MKLKADKAAALNMVYITQTKRAGGALRVVYAITALQIICVLCIMLAAPLPHTAYASDAVKGNDDKNGFITADSYRFAANQTVKEGEQQYDISFAAAAYPDESISLVSFYLSGADIIKIAEFYSSYSDALSSGQLFMSGVVYEYNVKRPRLDRVSDIYIAPSMLEKSRSEIEPDKEYRAVADEKSIDVLKELLSCVPSIIKTPYDKINNAAYVNTGSGNLSAQDALSQYLSSFSQADGIDYESLNGRAVSTDSLKPSDFFKNSSSYFYIVIFSAIAVIIAAVIIIRVLVYIKHKKKVFIE